MNSLEAGSKSIQRRLMMSFMATTGAVLVLTSAAFVGTQYYRFSDSIVTKMRTLADVIGSNSIAALLFDDIDSAYETLSGLQAETHVMAAVLYDESGKVFAQYVRADVKGFRPPASPELGHAIASSTLDLASPIVSDRDRVGTIFIRADMVELSEFIQVFALIVLVVFAGAAGVSWYGASRLRAEIANPIIELSDVATRLSEGDLSAQVDVVRDDEIGLLASSFNSMASSLRGLVKQVRENTGAVTQATEVLERSSAAMRSESAAQEQAVEGTAESIERITSSIQEVNSNVESLSGSAIDTSAAAMEMSTSIAQTSNHIDRLSDVIDTTASSVVQMTSAIKEIAESADTLNGNTESTAASLRVLAGSVRQVEANAKESHELSEQATVEASRGVASVQETVDGMKEIQVSFQGLQEVISSLDEKSGSIGEVVKVIQGVVEQTNLLALNAAIISSQAGEHGRAFSVVAEEVRHLAERTAASTREIAELIDAVQAGVSSAVEAMQKGGARVDKGVQLANEAVTILQAIGSSAQQTSIKVREIFEATAEQAKDIGKVDSAMDQVKDIAAQLGRGTHEQDSASTEIKRGVEQMRALGLEVKTAANEQRRESNLISKSVETVAEQIKQILESTKDQSKQADQILQALSVFREVTEQTSRRAEETTTTISDLASHAQGLEEEIGRFRV